MSKDNNTGKKLAIGAAIAGVAGYVAGILTAPKSGQETRQDIVDTTTDIKDDVLSQLKQAQDDLADLLETAKTKTVALSAKAREEYNEAIVRAKDAKNKSGAVIKSIRAGSSEDPDLDKALRQARQAYKNLAKYIKS